MEPDNAFRIDRELTVCPECAASVEHMDFGVGGGKSGNFRLFYVSGCKSCGMIFTNPPPKPDEIEAHYGEDGEWNQRVADSSAAPPEGRKAKIGLPSDTSHIGRIVRAAGDLESPYVLDFGCGEGELLNSLSLRGWRVCGIDPATKHIITWHEMRDELPTEPTFDGIIAKHVIEHLPNPLTMLRLFRKALKPGGFLCIGVPCLDGAEVHGKKNYCINSSHHLTAYSGRSLRHMLKVAGFDVEIFYRREGHYRFSVVARPATDAAVLDQDPIADARATFAACLVDKAPPQERAQAMVTKLENRAAREQILAAKEAKREASAAKAERRRLRELRGSAPSDA